MREFTVPDLDGSSQVHAWLDIARSLACQLAGMAHDAPIGVEEETVLLARQDFPLAR
jgi:hypothetical protein